MQTAGRIIACCFQGGGQGKTNYTNSTSVLPLTHFQFHSRVKSLRLVFFFYLLTSKTLGRVPSGEKLCGEKCQV